MRRNFIAGLLAIALTSLGCGSSGGDPAAQQNDTPVTFQETLQALQRCVAPDLEQVTAILQLLEELAQADSLPEELSISINLLAGGINFEYPVDLDGDGETDSTLGGLLTFRDADGNATIPFDLTNLPTTLEEALAQLDDDESVRINYTVMNEDDGISGSGVMSVAFADGMVSAVSGDGSITSDVCTFDFDLGTLALADLLQDYPVADVRFDINVDGARSSGHIDLDGTSAARAYLNGFEFEFDLDGFEFDFDDLDALTAAGDT
ncbi:MAG: hypothetical protein V3T86_09500 [Planctomycetota bacterium]